MCLCEISLVSEYRAERKQYPMKNPGRRRYGMIYTVEGSETLTFSDMAITLTPDTVLVIPEGEKYTLDSDTDTSRTVTVDFSVAGESEFRPFLVKLEKNNTVKSLFFDILREWQKKLPESDAFCKSAFYRIIMLLIHQTSTYTNTEKKEKIARAVEILHRDCFTRSFRIEALSEASGMSRRNFEKLFSEVYGTSPGEYISNLKISLAKEMLLSERETITRISEHLGYSDVYHFSKVFKAKTGYTPTEYKKNAIV